MPKLVFRPAARKDLAEIARYIEREDSHEAAAAFIGKIVARCKQIAALPGRLGRPRPELRKDYRSIPFGRYLIFFRYADEEGPRSHLYIIGIKHASRDAKKYFKPLLDN